MIRVNWYLALGILYVNIRYSTFKIQILNVE